MCHETCFDCLDEHIWSCMQCMNGHYMQAGSNICLPYCATGYSGSGLSCIGSGVSADFNFYNLLARDFNHASGITISGGFFEGDNERDDPIPIENRGLWFDGCNAYQRVLGLTLHHSFSLEFWVKNHKAQYYESNLFGTYATADANCYTSVVRFSIYDECLIFKDFRNNIFVSSENAPNKVREKVWAHAGINVCWD